MTQRLTQELSSGKDIYTGLVTPMPGSPDVAVSHAVFRLEGDGGAGKLANLIRIGQIKKMGYSAVICIVDLDNTRQREILKANNWLEGPQFLSRRTKHNCSVWIQQL